MWDFVVCFKEDLLERLADEDAGNMSRLARRFESDRSSKLEAMPCERPKLMENPDFVVSGVLGSEAGVLLCPSVLSGAEP